MCPKKSQKISSSAPKCSMKYTNKCTVLKISAETSKINATSERYTFEVGFLLLIKKNFRSDLS